VKPFPHPSLGAIESEVGISSVETDCEPRSTSDRKQGDLMIALSVEVERAVGRVSQYECTPDPISATLLV